MQVGTADVEALARGAVQQEDGHKVGYQPDQRNDQHDAALDWDWMQEPFVCLAEQDERNDDHRPGVDARRQDLGAAIAERVLLVVSAPPQPQRPQRQDAGQGVRRVVKRVGKQRQRSGDEAADDLGDSNDDVHQDGDEQVAPGGQLVVVVVTHGALPFLQDGPARTRR